MSEIKVRRAKVEDAVYMAEILREIGWSERRNEMKLEEISKPIESLIEHSNTDKDGHTIYVAVDENNKVIGFTNVHWVPYVMLGSFEGYISDVFVSPGAGGKGAGSLLVKTVIFIKNLAGLKDQMLQTLFIITKSLGLNNDLSL
jgi:N-acetylglutamate synthase-like GNAT family acetyltransferase